jgi:putative membrane protein insertion efficiency factor
MIRAVLLSVLRAYRWLVSPVLPAACRFHPTCSSYAVTALERHGALRGGWLAARRIARCHPFHPGGIDPVPDAEGRRTRLGS